MFTGIIQNTGKITKFRKDKLTIKVGALIHEIKKGGSIAVDGVCLTAAMLQDDEIMADAIPETLKKTNLGGRKEGDLVNLELALIAGDRLEGHLVSGHVDGIGMIESIVKVANAHLLQIQVPKKLMRTIVPKGSIAINGISLTVIEARGGQISVGIIPHTWETTNLRLLKPGEKVNIETDLMAKYFEKWQK